MKRTFKEKAVFASARISKKNKLLTPLAYSILGIVLFFYYGGKHICDNGKRYISVGVVLLFFLMSSSFASADQNVDAEVYLANTVNGYDGDISIDSEMFDNILYESSEADYVLSSEELLLIEKDIEIESLNESLTYTLEDFYNEHSLLDTDKVIASTGSFDKNSWNLILVNKTHPLPDDYEVPLATIKGSMECDERALEPLTEMLTAASKDGIELIVCSPYREEELQERLFLRKINAYMSHGKSYLEAYKLSSLDVIVPGTSEHQLGLAFDIVVGDHYVLDAAFGNTKAGIWLRDNCAKYGFILRYPQGKELITGIDYEPWHFRYVGVEAATYITDNGLSLEEFIEELQ